jgi:hypothetical protein
MVSKGSITGPFIKITGSQNTRTTPDSIIIFLKESLKLNSLWKKNPSLEDRLGESLVLHKEKNIKFKKIDNSNDMDANLSKKRIEKIREDQKKPETEYQGNPTELDMLWSQWPGTIKDRDNSDPRMPERIVVNLSDFFK